MDSNNDEYIVEFCSGDKHYFKNGKLHCETGPAVVHDMYKNLVADQIYSPKDVTLTGRGKYVTYFEIDRYGQKKEIFKTTKGKNYYLEGIAYTQKEFETIKLQNELEKELDISTIQHKKMKL